MGASIVKISDAGTDAYCKLQFAGGKKLKTKVVQVKANTRFGINPEFNYELWYPVSIPTMTQLVKFGVYDKDSTGSELIANIIMKYNEIEKMIGKSTGLRWFNMYGSPDFKTEKGLSNIKKGVVELYNKTKTLSGYDIDWFKYYNIVPDRAPSFKGRGLLKFRIEQKRPRDPKYAKYPDNLPFRRNINKHKILKSQEPASREYRLRALFLCGTDLPEFGTVTNDKLMVKISIGLYELSTTFVSNDGGSCRWNELKESDPLMLPIDHTQIPDLFIYLVKESDKKKCICFKRLKPVINKIGDLIGFNEPTQWFLLQEDKSINALSDGIFPGNILIKLGFGLVQEAEATRQEWVNSLEKSLKTVPYQVRVHVYQCKNVPPADANGLADPFVEIHLMGIHFLLFLITIVLIFIPKGRRRRLII